LDAFRDAVRPAIDWIRGQFERGDDRPQQYGLGQMPPRTTSGILRYAEAFHQANAPERNLEPPLPERLLARVAGAR